MKILLLGGTGAMGIPLSHILYMQGDDVYVTSRSKTGFVNGVNYVTGNAHSIDFLKELLRNQWDAIVDFLDYSTDEFNERLGLLLNSTRHYLFLSSSRVYADSSSPITEETPRLLDITNDEEYLDTDEYALHKAREENILRQYGSSNYTIIRPYITYNYNRLQLGVLEKEQWAYRLLQGRTVVFSYDIAEHYTTLTYANDVAYCMSKLICNPLAMGEAFHIATEQNVLWSDVLELYKKVYKEKTGKEARNMIVEKALNLTHPIKKYQVLYDRYFDRRFDNSKIKKIVGDFVFTDVTKGLSDCFSRFIDNPSFRYISMEDETIRNEITGDHFQLKEIPGKKNKIKYIAKRLLGMA